MVGPRSVLHRGIGTGRPAANAVNAPRALRRARGADLAAPACCLLRILTEMCEIINRELESRGVGPLIQLGIWWDITVPGISIPVPIRYRRSAHEVDH